MTIIKHLSSWRMTLLLLLGICSVNALAISTDLQNIPLPALSSTPPNIMLMLDTSGSMNNIVPDTPYNASVTYTNCPSANILPGGAATLAGLNGNDTLDVRIDSSDGSVTITVSGNGSGRSGRIFGTGTNQICFDSTLLYNGRLFANGSSGGDRVPSGYLDASYSGNFLNWYFCTGAAPNCNTADNFGAGANSKLGTQTRLMITRTAAKNIVDSLDTVRTGLTRYNASGNGQGGQLVVSVDLNTATQKTTMKNAIDALTASGATPLAETLSGIGGFFAKRTTGDTGGAQLTLHPNNPSSGMVPSTLNQATDTASNIFTSEGTYPLVNAGSASPPIQAYCQKSFAVLMTDGRPQNDEDISSALCNYLGLSNGCSAKGQLTGTGNGTGANAGYHVNTTTGSAAKFLHIGGTHDYESAGSGYLANVAAALFEMDLRPDLTKPAGFVGKNNILTYAIALADAQAINDPLLQEAAAAGGGLFLTANNSAELVAAFERATDDILAKDGSTAAVAVANAHVTNTDNASYGTSYNLATAGGDLVAYPLNTSNAPLTGAPIPSGQQVESGAPNIYTPVWDQGCPNPGALVDPLDVTRGVLGCSAQVQLDLRTPASRLIFTSNDTATCFNNCGIPFQPTTATGTLGVDKLSTAQQTLLNTPTLTDGAAVINYLRGDTSGDIAGTYRNRAHILGDAVNAEPAVVREPSFNYTDAGYLAYKLAQLNRARIILQATNDGMLHAFNSQTGAEEWAYVPNILISESRDPNSATTSLLNTRTRKANFIHYFLVDATPIIGDVDFGNTQGAPSGTDWHTIVVGGLGKGGRGYYALDVTSPTATTEATLKSKALWEFPRSIVDNTKRTNAFRNLGYSYGKPIITKTAAAGWVVLIPSGYNNGTNAGDSGGDGLAHLYVVNAKTGDLIADLVTPACTTTPASNPCGMAHIAAYAEDKDTDNTSTVAYGGDLYGNVWRFDLRGTTVSGWAVTKLAVLRSGSAATDPVQPITTVPELAKINISGTDKFFVYVGTGRYLGQTDLPCPPTGSCAWTPNSQSTQTQTLYGLVDPRDGGTSPQPTLAAMNDPIRPDLVQQTVTTAAGGSRTLSTNAVNYATKKGFYINFTGGERIVTDPALAAGTLVFTSNVPSTTQCIPGGSSFINFIDYQTGGNLVTSTGTLLRGGQKLKDALASRPVLIQLPSGAIKALVRLSDTTTSSIDVPLSGNAAASRRVSYRELIDQ